MRFFHTILLILLTCSLMGQTVITSAATGLWNAGGTWVGGVVPGSANKVVIAHTVTLNVSTSITGLVINDGATLIDDPNTSLTLTILNKNIECYGTWERKPASQAVVTTCKITGITESAFTGGGMNVLANDPGLWVMGGNMGDPGAGGKLDWVGATKTAWLNTTGGLSVGATSLTLASVPVGWQVGDSIVITPTESPALGAVSVETFEERVIATITGAVITFAGGLTRSHPAVTSNWSTWTPEVINLTRNVRFEGTSTGKTHIFIRSARPQNIKFTQLKYMGPRKDRSSPTDGINEFVSGRYAFHFHHNMDGSKGSTVEGNVVKFTDSHCYVPHVSDSIYFKDNISYDTKEIAYWWDPGEASNRITFDHNIAAKITYVPGSLNKDAEDAPTFSTSGFLFSRGDDNSAINNVVVGNVGDPNDGGAYNWEATIIEGVWLFKDNIAHNNQNGLRVWQNSTRNHVIDNYVAYNNILGVLHGAYANSYTYIHGEFYQNEFEVKASSTHSTRVRIEDIKFDGGNTIPHGIRVISSPVPGSWPIWIRDCDFSNFVTSGIRDDAGAELKSIDILNCTALNGVLFDYDVANMAPTEVVRIQPTSGQTIRITNGTQTNISRFAAPDWGTGTGLKGSYYNSINFTDSAFSREESTIAFSEWSSGVHHKIIDSTNMSVRMTGKVKAQFTEPYTFILGSAGGHRLWVNNQLIINNWTDNYPDAFVSSSINLVAGTEYDIKLEYFNTDQYNGINLYWQSPSTVAEYVPQTQLYLPEAAAPGNQAPIASAGPNQTITSPTSSVTLNGSNSSDPDGTIAQYTWTRISGPNFPVIVSPNSVSTAVNGLVVGVYVFQLMVTDNLGAQSSPASTVQITVNATANQAPTANAGPDQNITVDFANVSASASTDADGTIVGFLWSKVSGPSSYTISGSSSSSAQFLILQTGVYVFQLQVTDDDGAISTDNITITVVAPTAYYVSASGNNSNDGRTTATAWQTIAKVNSSFSSLSPGDYILFNRGETFAGGLVISRSGTSTEPITFGAYGTGAAPKISGLTTVTGWTNLGGDIYQASLNSGERLSRVTVDGVAKFPGRWPNTGWLTVESQTYQNYAASTITSNGLSGATGLPGTEIVNMKNFYTLDRSPVTAFSGTTVTYTSTTGQPANNGFGFFFQNGSTFLDQTNEWFYNPTAQTLRIFGNPAAKVVKAATVQDLVSIPGNSYINFRDLSFEGADSAAFRFSGAVTKINVTNCTFNLMGTEGFFSANGGGNDISFVTIDSCTIRETNGFAVLMYQTRNSSIKNSTIIKSGMTYGQGRTGSEGYGGLYFNGARNLIYRNRVDSVGSIGVAFAGGDSIKAIENVISNYCMTYPDAGGIYTNGGGSLGRQILRNIVYKGIGNVSGTYATVPFGANGLYLDESATDVLVQGNTVFNTVGNGIYVHQSTNSILRGNTLYNNPNNSIRLTDDSWPYSPHVSGIRVVGNIAFAKNIDHGVIDHGSTVPDLYNFGTYDSNFYARPFEPFGVMTTGYQLSGATVSNWYDLPGWRSKFSWDNNGTAYTAMAPFKVASNVGGNLFANSTITSTAGFNAYAPITITTETKLDGTALKVTSTPAADSTNKQRFEIRFGALAINKTFKVTFSAIGSTNKENIQVFWIDDPNNYNIFGTNGYVPIRTTRTENTFYVTTNSAKTNMTLVFEVRPVYTPFWVDNIVLQEVTGAVVNIDDSIRLEYNPTVSNLIIPLGNNYRQVNTGTAYTGRITLAPFASAILRREINASPVANAGTNISITLPTSSTALNGSGTDADGTISAYQWTQVSGPNVATFTSTTIAAPTVSGLIAGNYSLRLRVTDNAGYQDSATVQIMVNSGSNQSPSANAGADQVKTLPTTTATLAGSGSDPDGTITTYAWVRLSGPAASFNNAAIAAPVVTFSTAGTIVLQLTVTDNNGATATDQMSITVNAAGNVGPSADAGPNKTVTLPATSVAVTGSGSDPDGFIEGYLWQKISGPILYTITSPMTAATSFTNLVEGQYVFRLTVTDDGGASAFDDVIITVGPAGGTGKFKLKGRVRFEQQPPQ